MAMPRWMHGAPRRVLLPITAQVVLRWLLVRLPNATVASLFAGLTSQGKRKRDGRV